MSIEMDVAKQIIDEKISGKITFSLEDIKKEVSIQGGVDMIAPGVSILDYVKSLEDKGIVKYNPYNKDYIITDSFGGEVLKNINNRSSPDKN
jgi:hypothetical protein